jgi:DNA-dependent RNA polymerase auxiliary subunit epsilon
MKIAVTTPVKHLQGIESLLSTKGEIFYLEEGTKSEVRELLLKENIETIEALKSYLIKFRKEILWHLVQ